MNYSCVTVLVIAWFGLAGAQAEPKAQPLEWKAGAATVDITPTRMIWMAGYASRNKPAEGVMQHLFAKALAIADREGGRMVFVTADLVGIPLELRQSIEKQAGEKYGLPAASLLLNASHTHCGPELRVKRMKQDGRTEEQVRQSEEYFAELEKKITAVIGQAIAAMEPAKLGYSHARCGFAMNRRLPTATGFSNSPNPAGPVDQAVPVLRVEGADGKLRAVLFGYACHNTTLSFFQFCGDYAGFAQQYLQENHPGMTALFMMGCGGDQNPYPRRQVDHASQHGRALANAVEAALEPKSKPLTGPLHSSLEYVTLDFAPIDPAKLAEEAKSRTKAQAEHAARVMEALRTGTQRTTLEYPVQAVQFGKELTMVALAGEVVVDYSLRLKKEIDSPAVWVAGYSNHVFGYVPSLRVLREGGYEGGQAMWHTAFPGPFAESVEERIIATVHRAVKRVKDGAGGG